MTASADPTDEIRRDAMTLSGGVAGSSCTQSSFKVGKGTFLFLGPGSKGQGFKAMFKLAASIPEAQKLAAEHPERFEVGRTGWVTARFTVEEPLSKRIWKRWLAESYDVTCGATQVESGTRRTRKPKR